MPRQPLPEPPRPFSDPIWTTRPTVAGEHLPIWSETDGVPWRAVIESAVIRGRYRYSDTGRTPDIGWERVVGLTIGPGAEVDEDTRADGLMIAAGVTDTTGPRRDVVDLLPAIARDVELQRRVWEDTRRLVVDLNARQLPNKTRGVLDKLSVTHGQISEEERALIASHAVELLVRNNGITEPGPWLDRLLGVSEATRKRVVDRAIELGFLPPRTRGRFRPESWDGYSATRSPDGRVRPKRAVSKPKGARK